MAQKGKLYEVGDKLKNVMGKKKTECQSTYETFQNCEKKKPQFTTYSHTAKVCYEKEDMIEGGRRSINRKKSTQKWILPRGKRAGHEDDKTIHRKKNTITTWRHTVDL